MFLSNPGWRPLLGTDNVPHVTIFVLGARIHVEVITDFFVHQRVLIHC